MTSDNLDLLMKILSAGVIASFVTGFFSVIICIKTNKRLRDIELIKHKYDLEKQKCDQLETHLKELVQNEKKFQYHGEIEHTVEFVKEVVLLHIEMYAYIKKEHESHSFLFKDDENKEIQEHENTIDNYVGEFTAEFRNSWDDDKFVEYLGKIVISIDEFKENYHLLIKNKIKEIFNK